MFVDENVFKYFNVICPWKNVSKMLRRLYVVEKVFETFALLYVADNVFEMLLRLL